MSAVLIATAVVAVIGFVIGIALVAAGKKFHVEVDEREAEVRSLLPGNNCGACARLCPMGAIDPKNVSNVPGTCIKCQRCVRKCTKGAKYFDDEAFLSHVKMLEQNFAEPKDNEVFL